MMMIILNLYLRTVVVLEKLLKCLVFILFSLKNSLHILTHLSLIDFVKYSYMYFALNM